MKNARFLAFAAILSALCSCASLDPSPPPNPAPEPAKAYLVRELGEDGKMQREWTVSSYQHTFFPRRITFKDDSGQTVTLTKSFEVLPVR